MRSFSVVQANAQLSALLDVVEGGEDVDITRRGRAFARLTGPEQAADRSFDLNAFLAVATSQPMHDGQAADTFIENLREQARF